MGKYLSNISNGYRKRNFVMFKIANDIFALFKLKSSCLVLMVPQTFTERCLLRPGLGIGIAIRLTKCFNIRHLLPVPLSESNHDGLKRRSRLRNFILDVPVRSEATSGARISLAKTAPWPKRLEHQYHAFQYCRGFESRSAWQNL